MLKLKKEIKKQKGLSLVESLIVLGLLAGIITVISQNASKATTTKNTQLVNQEIFQIYNQVQKVYSDDGTDGISNSVAAQLGIKPPTTRGNNSTWRHSFEGLYNLGEISGGDDFDFQLEATNIPTGQACTEIISESKRANWTQIKVGSTTNDSDEWGPSEIATACNNSSNSSVDITFIYDVD